MPNGASGDVLDSFRQGAAETFEDAFETLFRLHQHSVYRWLLRIVRNPATAEDLTVETFLRIYRAHARFDPDRRFEPWARTVATHVAFDWLRAQRPETELTVDMPAPSGGDPGISAEIRSKTALAFSRLPPGLRIAAVLAVVEELPQREIADALGISVAAVKVRVFRALRLLRKDLQKQGITP
jgi:RNA polymerase sigma factor (sigma-70 family)